MTKELIAKAFEKTGVYPVNRAVFEHEEFAPSKTTSSIANIPDSFPHVPSSDPIEPPDDCSSNSDGDSDDIDFIPSLLERQSELSENGSSDTEPGEAMLNSEPGPGDNGNKDGITEEIRHMSVT